ncbi:unnamed protein product [Tetraodon nigroviridis]|uniref:(spotted green pufferfish) hypothetical protein n=1 Tax=Tetraodon nigroviridis TaxID=99883 RepID=Q4SU61_TETNG|nr:unnamed protein product [Tetraodon nigroviridis]
MSGRGKTGGKARAKAKTRSSRAGLQFPVGRVHRLLRKGNYAERGRRRAGVPGGRAGVPDGGDPGAGRQRCPRQQEDAHHPAAPAAGRAQRRGAEQAAGRSDHRPGRRAAQHPGGAAAQEDGEGQVSAVEAPNGSFQSPHKLQRAGLLRHLGRRLKQRYFPPTFCCWNSEFPPRWDE